MQQGNHGGNVYQAATTLGCQPDDIDDYSSNVADSQPLAVQGLDVPRLLARLPEPHSGMLQAAFAEQYRTSPEHVCVTAGTTEAIERICALFAGKRVTIFAPTYSDYAQYARAFALEVQWITAPAPAYAFVLSDVRLESELCFVCNPNNPTGQSVPRDNLLALIKRHPATLFVIDESYLPFHTAEAELTLTDFFTPNMAILRSFSKIHGLPGLRLGFVLSGNTALIAALKRQCSPWNVNSVAQELGIRLLTVDTQPIAQAFTRARQQMLDDLRPLHWLQPLPSTVNFLLCHVPDRRAADLFQHCLARKVLIRDCGNFTGLCGEYIRFSIKSDMAPLLRALREVL